MNIRKILANNHFWHLKKKSQVTFFTEKNNWSIRWDGIQLREAISKINSHFRINLSNKPFFANANIFHFGSQFAWENWHGFLKDRGNIVVTFFHGKLGDSKEIDDNLAFLAKNQSTISRVIISFSEMRPRLEALGISSEKIIQIPIGVDLQIFNQSESKSDTQTLKDYFGIPAGFKIVGSFQKDGEGWGSGDTPKMIKGPDLLWKTLQKINENVPIFVILTGPARGYVKAKLNLHGIPFKHIYLHDYTNVSSLYKILDLYLVTSREEGGPKGLIESLASGCPVVTTPVGMASDVLGKFGSNYIAKEFNPNELADLSMISLISPYSVLDKFGLRELVDYCDWRKVAQSHLDLVYKPIIESLK